MNIKSKSEKHSIWGARVESSLAHFVNDLALVRDIDKREVVKELNIRYLGKGKAKNDNNMSATPLQRDIIK